MLLLASLALLSAGSSSHAKSAATGFAIAKNDPVKLRNFLLRMPKGGDLHNHLTGTIYAESYLGWAAEDGKCWDSSARSIVPGPCSDDAISFADVYPGGRLTPRLTIDPIIDSLSTRNFRLRGESGHNQFFATFARFAEATIGRRGEMLAEATHRAGHKT